MASCARAKGRVGRSGDSWREVALVLVPHVMDIVSYKSQELMRVKRQTAALDRATVTPSLSAGRLSADSARQALAQTFLKRSVKMLERASSSATSEALKSALSSPTDIGGVASLLSDLAPRGVDLSAVGPFMEAMARGAGIKQELLTNGGGGLMSSQVASALGITRKQWTNAEAGARCWRCRMDPVITCIRLASSLRTE